MQIASHANQTSQNSNSLNGWTADEKKQIAAIVFPMIEMQKQYGKKMDAKIVMRGWEIKLANRYSIQDILYALDEYTDRHDDFPTPANIIEILEPPEPRITEAQFIAAQKWQERNNNWGQYTDAAETIADYHRQNENDKNKYFQMTSEGRALLSPIVKNLQLTNQGQKMAESD